MPGFNWRDHQYIKGQRAWDGPAAQARLQKFNFFDPILEDDEQAPSTEEETQTLDGAGRDPGAGRASPREPVGSGA